MDDDQGPATNTSSADYPEEYQAYFEHFERGEYYECHEALEKLWLRDKNRFYQALIQLAVALYHLERGNTEGGRKLLAAAEEKLREYPPGHMGLDTPAVAEWCVRCRAALPADRREGPPVQFPTQWLSRGFKNKSERQ